MRWLDSLFEAAIEFAVFNGYDNNRENEEDRENDDKDD